MEKGGNAVVFNTQKVDMAESYNATRWNVASCDTMNKMGLVDAVHEKIGGTKKAAEDAVDALFDEIMRSLSKGEEVAVSGFGSFTVKRRAARMGVNPRTGQKIQIAQTTTPKFKAGKALKEAVK